MRSKPTWKAAFAQLRQASANLEHSLDEQSDIGLSHRDDPNTCAIRASSDFDRTNVFSANFQVQVPNVVRTYLLLLT